MGEILANFSPGQIIGLVAVTGGILLAAVSVMATQWRRVRIAELETALKQQMLEKGMSPAEIEKVVNASPGAEGGLVVSTGNENADRAVLVQRMVDEGYEGEDIERVLKAYQTPVKKPEEKPVAHQV